MIPGLTLFVRSHTKVSGQKVGPHLSRRYWSDELYDFGDTHGLQALYFTSAPYYQKTDPRVRLLQTQGDLQQEW